MYFIYSNLLVLALVLTLPYWLLQMGRHGKYRAGLWQRMGSLPEWLEAESQDKPIIWIHAVSVGEVLAISRLVHEMRSRFPLYRIVVSTTTHSGQKLAQDKFGSANVFYFPLDFPIAIRPYLKALQPNLVVLAETEFWPNFLRLAKKNGARIIVVNARISDRSWPGYRRMRFFLRRIVQPIDRFLAQGEEDRKRLIEIGAPAERIQITGNLKFDVQPPSSPPVVASLRSSFAATAAGPVVVAGSTLEGEEPVLLRAFEIVRGSYPRAVMILAPRHPQRFAQVAELVSSLGIPFWRRSLWSGEDLAGAVLLLDTIGELASVYALGELAFVGGSLVEHGGHNILEPAQHGVPTLIGPSYYNFRDIVNCFRASDAVRVVEAAELPLCFMELLANASERLALGQRARETVCRQRGATLKTLEECERLLCPASA